MKKQNLYVIIVVIRKNINYKELVTIEFYILLADLSTEDQDFVWKLYEDYREFMYQKAYDILKDEHDAADAVQDAMVKIIKFLDKFNGNSTDEIRNLVVIGIRSTIERKSIDHYNTRKRKYVNETDLNIKFDDDDESKESDIEDYSADIEQLAIVKETQEAVQKAICKLPQNLQDAINLVYFSGYSQVEAAEYLGIKDGTMRKRIFTARKQLAESLRGEYGKRNEE